MNNLEVEEMIQAVGKSVRTTELFVDIFFQPVKLPSSCAVNSSFQFHEPDFIYSNFLLKQKNPWIVLV